MVTEPLFKVELSESQFQGQVQDFATLSGWSWLHVQKVANDRGYWRTPVSGKLGKGWPDLFLVRGDRRIAAELKAGKKQLEPDQVTVLNLLEAAGCEVFCWRPSDWDSITEVLR
jgi:hypothetical protein